MEFIFLLHKKVLSRLGTTPQPILKENDNSKGFADQPFGNNPALVDTYFSTAYSFLPGT